MGSAHANGWIALFTYDTFYSVLLHKSNSPVWGQGLVVTSAESLQDCELAV